MLFENLDFNRFYEMRDELYLDRRNCIKTVAHMLENVYPRQRYIMNSRECLRNGSMDEYEAQEFLFLHELYMGIWQENTRTIFDYAESPIEITFLNAFNMFCILSRFSQLVYTHPYSSLTQEIEDYRKNYENFLGLRKAFIEFGGNPQELMYAIEQANISEEAKNIYRACMIFTIYTYDNFHVTLQPTIDDFFIQGKHIRPDIFIWIPSKPEFKLIIELDGFAYHSNRRSFSEDRVRDRMLQERGYQVLRFSGDEIKANPLLTAQQLRDFLLAREDELFKDD